MVNVNLLKSYMVKAGYTQKMLAQELGISEQTLTRKLKKRVFGTDEASKIVELLSIDNPQAVFFWPLSNLTSYISREVKKMKIKITGEPKEIAALVLAVQGRQNREVLAIGEISAKGHSNDLVTKDSQNREIHNGTCGFQTSIL